jgi:hypothetical protein
MILRIRGILGRRGDSGPTLPGIIIYDLGDEAEGKADWTEMRSSGEDCIVDSYIFRVG